MNDFDHGLEFLDSLANDGQSLIYLLYAYCPYSLARLKSNWYLVIGRLLVLKYNQILNSIPIYSS